MLLAAFAAPGCVADESVRRSTAAIVGGMEDTADPAVVFLDGPQPCSGVLLSKRVVLTAAHCLEDARNLAVVLGDDVRAVSMRPRTRIFAVHAKRHPLWDPLTRDYDLGLVTLEKEAEVEPVRLLDRPLDDGFVGLTARMVGFGKSGPDEGSLGIKRVGRATIRSWTPVSITTDASPNATCGGDSGGATFITVDGIEWLAGVPSRGDLGCASFGVHTRVDPFVAAFIRPYLDAARPGGAAFGEPCGFDGQCAEGTSCIAALDATDVRYCSHACSDDAACARGLRCIGERCRWSPTPGSVGAPCERDGDCAGRLCVAERTGGARACGVACAPTAPTPCPSGGQCVPNALAPATYACISNEVPPPPNAEESGGCAHAARAPRSPNSLIIMLIMLAVSFVASRRRLRAVRVPA